MKNRSSHILFSVIFLLIVSISVFADEKNKKGGFSLGAIKDKVDASADSLQFVGSNIIAKGHVVLFYKNIKITADKAIVNISSKDFEAKGNVTFFQRKEELKKVDYYEYEDLLKEPEQYVTIEGYYVEPTGKQLIEVKIIKDENAWSADKVEGNFNSGTMTIDNFMGKNDIYYIGGKTAKRSPEGNIYVDNAVVTTCEYFKDGHEHYSIHAGSLYMYPEKPFKPGDINYPTDFLQKNTMHLFNTVFYLGKVPILWWPYAYKPLVENLHIQSIGGEDSDWGYFLLLSKQFQISNDPNITTKVLLDYYSKRGVGVGNKTKIRTEKTWTEFFAYGIRDRSPYGPGIGSTKDSSGQTDADFLKQRRRLENPANRYDMRLSNVSHITPRMDFRGHVETISDIDFLEHYFEKRAENDPQPTSFGSLEYQFDHFTTSLLVRPRVNDFFAVAEKLPELRVDIPRQELFKNIYYQGETSFANLRMAWREFDKRRTAGNGIDPKDYRTERFDSLHMFYYPLHLKWLNIIPRAGFRLTHYTRSSDTKISTSDIGTMALVDNEDGNPTGNVINYDDHGGSKLRFVSELGLEMNTKIYNSWQDVKSPFWELDGLRHVIVPYVNYNYISNPNEDREKIYYFDDIDRIDEQNFVRTGLKNRLQTRRGTYGNQDIYNWCSIENYFDYHMRTEKDFNHIGDFGTKLNFTPFPGLNISSELLIDAGLNSEHDVKTRRNNKNVGRKGISWKYINKWLTTFQYDITDNINIYGSYNYSDDYKQRSLYSMGSSLTGIESGTSFARSYGRYQTARLGAEFPIPIDDKTRGGFDVLYDVESGYMREQNFRIIRNLHCWEAALEFSQRESRDHTGDKLTKHSIMFTLYLTAQPGLKLQLRQKR